MLKWSIKMSTISKIKKLVTKLTKINDNCVFFKVRYKVSVFQNYGKDGVNQYDFETITQAIEFLESEIKRGSNEHS